MPEFLLVAVVLVLLASFFVFSPVMLNRSSPKADRQAANVAMFEQRLNELSQELADGKLTQEAYGQLKTELERRLLEEVPEQAAAVDTSLLKRPASKFIVGLVLFIPVIAWLVYRQTGAQADWEIAQTLKQARHQSAAGEDAAATVDKLVEQLSARLSQKPQDPHYLMLLGSTYLEMGNYPAATDAFQRLADVHPEDPSVLAQYAQSLYLSSNRSLTDKVQEIASKALSINPQQSTVLGLLGIANFELGKYQQAIDYWQRLLPMLGPVSPNRQMIEAGIREARNQLAANGEAVIEESPTESAADAASLRVQVSLAEHIKADPDASVFVYARAVGGPRMPLAVARIRVGDLPTQITLDDSMAMAPGMNLSKFEQVEVIARISKNGIANRGPGDIEGLFSPVAVAGVQSVSVVIDQVVN